MSRRGLEEKMKAEQQLTDMVRNIAEEMKVKRK